MGALQIEWRAGAALNALIQKRVSECIFLQCNVLPKIMM